MAKVGLEDKLVGEKEVKKVKKSVGCSEWIIENYDLMMLKEVTVIQELKSSRNYREILDDCDREVAKVNFKTRFF